ncbi:homoserine O-succinyltransferase [Acidihalobacter yilgarnensis]|uniref:Homoserine O-succinyltransferase n=1 Tax=Acidihalobacter yilgarnensis TaxID=2819280 RepID=A0A1D8IJX9_9GAMM|nr:homoserine O-succinyltransferase [Acidihalobacter yilgarnensis]AOU96789.1 homoserine O-succinyltransferase [Acidihalobacter yilgarnensis]
MPIVAHNSLPTFERLRDEGLRVLSPHRARNQDIRELHIGLLNMMPDKALAATERQFLRLVAQSNPIAQFYVHPFTLPELPRGEAAREHVERYYERFEDLREQGLDALIITGANVIGPELSTQPFWQPLSQIIEWAWENVTSTLCSCLATHAVLELRYGQRREPRPAKIWGVYPHRVIDPAHPLVDGINTRFDVPHSRWNAVTRVQFRQAGLRVLAESDEIGVHLATSADGFRFVFCQGHPEYDTISLLKEYKRELRRYLAGELEDYPPFVTGYFDGWSQAVLREYRLRVKQARHEGDAMPELPEHLLLPRLDNTWHDTAEAVVSNWIGLVYQLTHTERRKPFMDDIDPDNPLVGLRN